MTKLEYQQKAVEQVLSLVTSTDCNFYSSKYKDFGVSEKLSSKGISAWDSIPFLTREDIYNTPYYKRLYVPTRKIGAIRVTSGTSGKGILVMPRINENIKEEDPLLFNNFFSNCNCDRYATFSGSQYQHGDVFKVWYGIDSIHLDPGDMQVTSKLCKLYKPDALGGFAYAIIELYKYINEEVKLLEDIKVVYLFGERCTSMQWELLNNFFPNAVIIEDYGSVDAQTTIGFPCSEIIKNNQQFVHPLPEFVYTEVIDPDTGEVLTEKGQSGELVVTTLRKVASPVVRYKTGDLVTIIETGCPCGTITPVLSVDGRLDMDRIRFYSGELNVLELERVVKKLRINLSGYEFIAYYEEVVIKADVKIHLIVELEYDDEIINPEYIADKFAKELRISPTQTYKNLIDTDKALSISVKKYFAHGVNEKIKHLVRIA